MSTVPDPAAKAGAPWLVVVCGRAGTGKTTLSRRLAEHLHAAYLRIDAIETAVVRSGLASPPVGPVAYVVAHELAAANLALGTDVVVDAVNPVHEARAGWRGIAAGRLAVFETRLTDAAEHRRRVESREPDLADQFVPTWADVTGDGYQLWDEHRDGPRHVVDTADAEAAVAAAITFLAG